jgi:uncharacterized cupin superfamily protein
MKQITPLVYQWSQYDAEHGLDHNGHFVQAAPGAPGALLDPVALHPTDGEHIARLGGAAAVLITSAGLARERAAAAGACAARFGCPVRVPAGGDAPASVAGAAPFRPEDPLPAALTAVPLPGGAAPDETAFRDGAGTVFVGRGLVGAPAGQVSLPPGVAAARGAAARAARGLRALLARPVRRLLPSTGFPVLREPAAALQDLLYRHDSEAFLLRTGEAVWGGRDAEGVRFASRWAEYSRPLGLRALDFDLTEVPPGRQSCPLHRHDGEEEVFLVVAGRGEVLTDRGRVPVRAGDVLGFPPRYQVAHALANTGDEPLRYFAFGAPAEPLEMIDYPTSGARLERTPFGKRRRFYPPEPPDVPYWEHEPVDEPLAP